MFKKKSKQRLKRNKATPKERKTAHKRVVPNLREKSKKSRLAQLKPKTRKNWRETIKFLRK
jgi:hypothetical protein